MNQGAKQLIKDIFVFSMGTVMTKLIQFLLMPLYTSSLTTEAYGAAELVNNLAEFFYPILTLSAFEAVLRFLVGKEYGEKTIATAGLKLMILSAGGGIVLFSIIDLIGNYPYTTQLFWITYTYALKTMLSFFVRGKGYSKLFRLQRNHQCDLSGRLQRPVFGDCRFWNQWLSLRNRTFLSVHQCLPDCSRKNLSRHRFENPMPSGIRLVNAALQCSAYSL